MKRFFDAVDRLMLVVLNSGLILLVFLTFLQVVLRYFFNSPLTWVEEFLGIIMAFLVLFGAAWGVRNSIHISMEIFANKLFAGNLFIPTVLEFLLYALSGGLLIRYGWELSRMCQYQILPATGLRVCHVYLSIPISGAIMLIFALERLIELFAEHRAPEGGNLR